MLGSFEVAPLAYMRGRTLNRAFIILDEAQNTTREQMLMFLTPVFWLPSSLPGRAQYILWNPFAQMLDLLRTPLMGGVDGDIDFRAAGADFFTDIEHRRFVHFAFADDDSPINRNRR